MNQETDDRLYTMDDAGRAVANAAFEAAMNDYHPEWRTVWPAAKIVAQREVFFLGYQARDPSIVRVRRPSGEILWYPAPPFSDEEANAPEEKSWFQRLKDKAISWITDFLKARLLGMFKAWTGIGK